MGPCLLRCPCRLTQNNTDTLLSWSQRPIGGGWRAVCVEDGEACGDRGTGQGWAGGAWAPLCQQREAVT